MKEFGDTIHIDNFFTEDQLQLCEKAASLMEAIPTIHPYGVFPNQLIAKCTHLNEDNVVKNMFINIFANLLDCEKSKFDISELMVVTLHLPWDIHNDLHKNKIKPGFCHGWNFLIPLEDVNSRTIIFEQSSEDSNDFSEYKENHGKVPNPIDSKFWEDNLSFCWPHDREYLSLKEALPYQRRRQLLGFKRNLFHSSDNFHTRGISEKNFIQVRLDFAI
jgi:hypothetical protein